MGALILVLPGAVLLAWLWRTRPEQRRAVLTLVAAAGLGFQVLHVAEHVAQSAVWVTATDQPPFMSPWAAWGAEALAVTGHAPLGQELLHLVGNAIFMAGLLALAALARPPAPARPARLTRPAGPVRSAPAVRLALLLQGAHLAEHVLLTLTTALWGRAIGVTTLLGVLEAGPALWRLRVLAHLALNTAASLFAVAAVVQTRSARREPAPDPPHPPAPPGNGPAQEPTTSPRSTARSTAA